MSLQTWNEALKAAKASGTLLNTYTTSKSVINPEDLIVVPAGWWYVGRSVRIVVLGGISNIVTTPGTITFEVKLGPTANIVAFTTGAIQLNATAHTTLPFKLEIDLTCQVVGNGTSAKLMGQAVLTGVMFTKTAAATDSWGRISAADNAVSEVTIDAPITAPAQGTGFDSTTASILDFWAGFSISNSGNGIQIHQYKVFAEN